MPWSNGDYPPSYKNLPKPIREKAVEIANALLIDKHMDEGAAIAIGVKNAKEWYRKQQKDDRK
ncbi:hypothetical protein [Mucilaginibacter aquariorum]|uniref:DUF2188 domain-containing protein n=1 Tax=Mucilaginibacter aquariorum TaxID=2967225 RepID=A0ABT1SZ05_9SPHI|nr:hypothetical protein [Mucilaginibacter aquariorum]MCQ6957487.1 hypothetical protein [Mucilaginibacter aquariorum]